MAFDHHAGSNFSTGQERTFAMLDEMDGRLWAAHHNEYSLWAGRAFGRIRQGVARLASWDGTTHQLVAIVAALLVTSLGFTTTATA
jgi:hypothetical protein